jgi:hypothetical protein
MEFATGSETDNVELVGIIHICTFPLTWMGLNVRKSRQSGHKLDAHECEKTRYFSDEFSVGSGSSLSHCLSCPVYQ